MAMVAIAAFIAWQAWQGFRLGGKLHSMQTTIDVMNEGSGRVPRGEVRRRDRAFQQD